MSPGPNPTAHPHAPLLVAVAGQESETQQDHQAPGPAPRAPESGGRHAVQRGWLGADPAGRAAGESAAGAGCTRARRPDVQQQSLLARWHHPRHALPGGHVKELGPLQGEEHGGQPAARGKPETLLTPFSEIASISESDAETEAQRLNDLPTVTQSGVGGDGV